MESARRPFDPRTGDWLPQGPRAVAPDPEAPVPPGRRALWDAMLALDILALLAVTVTGLLQPPGEITRMGVVESGVLMLFLLGVVPIVWVAATRRGGWHGAMHYLRLERPGPSILSGIGIGILCWLAVILLAVLLDAAGVEPDPSPALRGLAAVLTWPLVVFVSLVAGFAEEVFFRGIVQRRLGVWVASALFGLAHASYGTAFQVVLPFALGIVFGVLVKRGARLWVVIAAHATFDLIQLGILMGLRDLGKL